MNGKVIKHLKRDIAESKKSIADDKRLLNDIRQGPVLDIRRDSKQKSKTSFWSKETEIWNK